MNNRPVSRVENYTNAFLCSAFVLLFTGLMVLWALVGYVPALVLAAGLNLLIPERKAH